MQRDLFTPPRNDHEARERRNAEWLALRAKGATLAYIARAYGVDRTTVMYATDPDYRERKRPQMRNRMRALTAAGKAGTMAAPAKAGPAKHPRPLKRRTRGGAVDIKDGRPRDSGAFGRAMQAAGGRFEDVKV